MFTNQADNMTNRPTEYLPISMLNQLEYCERRFYLMHVLGEMEVNVHVLEGALQHEQTHKPSREQEGDKIIHRRVYLWSEELGIAGFADVVEEIRGMLIPVEYKKGRMGRWLNDHIQLCAQAMCLEERSGISVDLGYIFYFGSRRREGIQISPDLRELTRQSVLRARELITTGVLPSPIENYNKCRDCSLEGVCLPREVKLLQNQAIQEF